MSTGQWIGAIVGVVLGILTFGTFGWLGIVYGAVLGYTIGGYIDPVKPDIKQPGAPAQQGLQTMTNVIGNPICDVLGTAKITGQLMFFGGEYSSAIWYRPARGVRAISGYKYYASWAVGICMGPVDCLYTIFRDQDPVWEGELECPASGGEATIQITGMGTMVFYFGTDDQVANTNAGTLLPESNLNTGHRHLCWAYFQSCFMNEYNRMPSMSFMVRKTPAMFSAAKSQIQIFDINPAHAIWHTLITKTGLPSTLAHEADFLAVATTLYGEARGISVLFDAHQPALHYIEMINNHVDSILRYGSDGKFHPKLIRYDYTPADLTEIDESKLLEEPTFSRRSWIDTINEVKVQYSEILGRPLGLTRCWSQLKHDEESGLTIVDHSPVAVNGELETGFGDPTTKFWSVPGFGHNDHTAPTTWVKRIASSRNVDYATIIAFIRPLGTVNMAFRGAAQLGEGGSNWFRIGWRTSPSYNWGLSGGNFNIAGEPVYSTTTFSLNTWYCIWAYVSPTSKGNIARMYVRSSGGAWELVIDGVASANLTGIQSAIYAFGSNNGNAHMDGGDLFYWADSTEAGFITRTEANSIYDYFKSRYGMS